MKNKIKVFLLVSMFAVSSAQATPAGRFYERVGGAVCGLMTVINTIGGTVIVPAFLYAIVSAQVNDIKKDKKNIEMLKACLGCIAK